MDLGWAVGALAVLTGLAAAATALAFGTQRGRVSRLEVTNGDLRKEIEDEKRRHATTKADLRAEIDKGVAREVTISEMRGEVTTMREVFTAMSGPLAALTEALHVDHTLLSDHHREAMIAFDYAYALQIDTLRLLGDKRSAARIRADLKAREEGDGGSDGTQ